MARSRRHIEPGEMPDTLAVGSVHRALFLLFALVPLAMLAAWALDAWLSADRPHVRPVRQVPEQPRLVVDTGEDLQSIMARGRARANAYGWTDREAGIAHIPLERAMALTAERMRWGPAP